MARQIELRGEKPVIHSFRANGVEYLGFGEKLLLQLGALLLAGGVAPAWAPMPGLNSPKYILELRFGRSFKRRFRTVTIAKGNGKKMCKFSLSFSPSSPIEML